jgi:DNA-binding IclR family transcriptional regulator
VGALERGDRGLRLGFRLFLLGERVPRHRVLRELALPYLEDLHEAARANVHLSILDGPEILFLAKVAGHRVAPARAKVGGRLPAYCTAAGKVLLAFGPPEAVDEVLAAGLPARTPHTTVQPTAFTRELGTVADRGYAVNREETELGLVAVAAPVFCPQKSVIAAVSVTGSAHHFSPERLAPAVRATTLSLSRALSRCGLAPAR